MGDATPLAATRIALAKLQLAALGFAGGSAMA